MFPEAKLYLFDLAGYGQPPMHMAERDVYLIAGWSDRVFDILAAVDKEPYGDRWGRFYSAYTPVYDSTGHIGGIVAVAVAEPFVLPA